MHEWLSGGASPCQGEGRGFESRLVLFLFPRKTMRTVKKTAGNVPMCLHMRNISCRFFYRTQGELTDRSREGPLEEMSAIELQRSGSEMQFALFYHSAPARDRHEASAKWRCALLILKIVRCFQRLIRKQFCHIFRKRSKKLHNLTADRMGKT